MKKRLTMVEQLRFRFIRTAMLSLLIILLLMMGTLNIANLHQIDSRADEILAMLAENNGYFPQRFPKQDSGALQGAVRPVPNNRDFAQNRDIEAPFETRYFWVLLDKNGQEQDIYMERIAAVSSEEASDTAADVYLGGKISGSYGSYRFLRKDMEDGSALIIFADRSSSLSSAWNLLKASLLVMAAALGMMFCLVWVLAGHAARPVAESLEKQKRFISDAGHELKTPLSIISANIDVLELTGEKNEWTQSIRSQIKRMTGLVNNLLTLSRMEEESASNVFSDTDFSRIVSDAVQPYETVALSKDLELSFEIAENLHVKGDARALTQLCTLLMDNAMKYASTPGHVQVRLRQEKNNVILEVTNDCDSIPDGDLNRLFDRFYRADASRNSKTGGSGIGLSVVAAIVNTHGGRTDASRIGDRQIRFRAVLPAHSA